MKNIIKAIILATFVLSLTQFLIAAAPTHDNWSSAELITGPSGSKTSTTAEATAQGCEPMHNFPDAGTQEPARTVWFKWLVPSSGSFTFKSNSLTPQSLSAYVMAPSICNGNVVTTPHPISENQLYLTPNQIGINTRINFGVQAGTLVFIAIDGYEDKCSGLHAEGYSGVDTCLVRCQVKLILRYRVWSRDDISVAYRRCHNVG